MSDNKNNSGNWNSGDWNSGNWNSGYWNSGNRNSGHRNSGYGNSGNWNSGHRNSGDWNSGYGNSGHSNSGYWNSGNRNSGIFNTDEPKMRCFNKDSEYTRTEYEEEFDWVYPDLNICQWISWYDMTDDEKEELPNAKDTDGYLKTMDYKEAWAEYWGKASEEDKRWFLALPNFSAEIFKEITGIDVNVKPSLSGKEVEVKLDGITYKAIIK